MSYLATPGTFSKSPLAFGLPADTTITEAHGARVTLNDGSILLDWVSGLGSNLMGFCDPDHLAHVTHHLHKTGGSLSLPSNLEAQVAEKLCLMLGSRVPDFPPDTISARFAKTGSDVTTMAVRLARAVTKRPYILTFRGGYHGWADTFISRTEPGHGLLPMMGLGSELYERKMWHRIIETDPYNFDAGGWYRWDEIAAVIFEVGIDTAPPGWWDYLRKVCDQTGTLLIADEVVTGLRYGLGGACERYGIKPDLVCMGKGLGNGLPISALIGRREYMDWWGRNDPVFCSSTMWGESVGLAAADYVLNVWDNEKVEYLWQMGSRLMECSAWSVIGHPCRSLFTFDNESYRAYFIQEMKARGVLCNRPNFPTLAHTEDDLALTLRAIEEVKAGADKAGPEFMAEAMKDCMPRVLFKNR